MQLSSVQVVEFIQFNMVLLKSFNKYTFRLDEQITFLHFLCFPLFLHHSVAVVTGHSLGLGWVGGVPPTTHVIAGSSKTPSSSFYITRWVQTARPGLINGHSHNPASFSSELTTVLMVPRLNGPAFFVCHICFANARWMESLSGDDDNAFAVTQRSPFAGGGWALCVCFDG